MGTSNWHNIPFCIEGLMKIAPKAILNVGIGYGRWGMVVREFCELWSWRLKPSEWQIRIEGIEAFSENIEEYHRHFYNKIHVGDFRQIVSSLPTNWSVVIFGDVIEHFEKNEGQASLQWALKASDYVMVNVPLGDNWPQSDIYGNSFERHLSVWALEDFDALPVCRYQQFRDYIGRAFGSFFLSQKDPNNLRKQLMSASTACREGEVCLGLEGDTIVPKAQLLRELQTKTQELDSIKRSRSYRIVAQFNQVRRRYTTGKS